MGWVALEKSIEKTMNHGKVMMSSILIHGNVMVCLAVPWIRIHLEKIDDVITI
jgi:hypothetical protein